MSKTKRKLSSRNRQPVVQKLVTFKASGEYFDLQAIFDKLNDRYFDGVLKSYTITWGRRRKLAPKEYFVFGTIQEEDRLIRINPRLDTPWVPKWFLEYVIYHEMLHAVVPDEPIRNGRRRVHTDEFNRREQEFRFYKRARQWEYENLPRLLR